MEETYFIITLIILLCISIFSLVTLIMNLKLKDDKKIKFLNKLTLILLCIQMVIFASWFVLEMY